MGGGHHTLLPLRCFARRLAILIGHQHTVPSLLVVGSSIPSFLVVGCSIRASFTCLFKKISNDGRGTPPPIPSPTLCFAPRLGRQVGLCTPFIFRWIRPWMSVDSPLSPTFQNRSAPVAIIFQPFRYTIAGERRRRRRLSESRLPSFLVVA